MPRILFKKFRGFSPSFNFAAKLIIETECYVAFFYWENSPVILYFAYIS